MQSRTFTPTPLSSSSFVESTEGFARLERLTDDDEERVNNLARFTSVGELMMAVSQAWGFSYADVRHLVLRFSAPAVEGAHFKTSFDVREGRIRNPRGWIIGTLRRGLQWSQTEISMQKQVDEEREVRKWEASNDVTLQRLAREKRAAAGQAAVPSPPGAGAAGPARQARSI